MQFKALALAALASTAVAQSTQSLAQALNSSSQLSALAQLLSAQTLAPLVATLSNLTNVTLLAPSNAAIAALQNSSTFQTLSADPNALSAVLQYHVLNGSYANFSSNATFYRTALMPGQYANVTGGQRVEISNTTAYSGSGANSTVNATAIQFSGGYIHIVDRVLSLPQSVSATATSYNLTSFYGALNASMTIPTINGLRDVTIFVPNNAAFRAIGSALGNLTMAQVVSILEYHVVNGTVAYSTQLRNTTLPTLQGGSVNITVHNATNVFVNNARVVLPNVLVANGVIHVIDQVLNPNSTMMANGTSSAGSPAYSGASSASMDPFTSGQPTPTSTINTASIVATATGGAGASSSSGAAWAPKATNAVGAAALGGLALLLQL